jgi:hypothetical protein
MHPTLAPTCHRSVGLPVAGLINTPKGREMVIQEQKTIAFVLYPGLTLLDLVGPLQVFASLRRFNDQYRPVVVAERIDPCPPTDRSR